MRECSLALADRALAEDAEALGTSFDQDEAIDGIVATKPTFVLSSVDLFGRWDVIVFTTLPSFAASPRMGEVHEASVVHERLDLILRDLVAPRMATIVEAVKVFGDLIGCGVVTASFAEVAFERAWVWIDESFPNSVERRRKVQRYALHDSVSHNLLLWFDVCDVVCYSRESPKRPFLPQQTPFSAIKELWIVYHIYGVLSILFCIQKESPHLNKSR